MQNWDNVNVDDDVEDVDGDDIDNDDDDLKANVTCMGFV